MQINIIKPHTLVRLCSYRLLPNDDMENLFFPKQQMLLVIGMNTILFGRATFIAIWPGPIELCT
jgi:hypothetical protein